MATEQDIEFVVKCLSSPDGYASLRLNKNLHPTHIKVLKALFKSKDNKVSFRAGNGTGKTSSVICSAILYALEIHNALVIATSGTYRQLVGQLMPNLKDYSNQYPNWEFLESAIHINGEKRFICFSSQDQGTAQGWHGRPNRPLLVVLDEAAALNDELYKAIDRCQPNWLLVCGSPLDTTGLFYAIETDPNFYKHFQHFSLPAIECVKSKGYWIEDKKLQDFIDKWGIDHPLTRSSVFGEFSLDNQNTILSLYNFDKCLNNPPQFITGNKQVGIDFAAGRAETIIALTNGNSITIEMASRNKDTMSTVGEIVNTLNRLKNEIGLRPNDCWADSDGMGVVFIDRLKELGWDINSFHGNSTPQDATNYKNKISECWLTGVKKIENCAVILPNDIDLKAQITGRRSKLHSSGRMMLESKEDLANRGIDSPDRADAVFMSLCPATTGTITSARAIGASHEYVGMFG